MSYAYIIMIIYLVIYFNIIFIIIINIIIIICFLPVNFSYPYCIRSSFTSPPTF
jgi:hypothetical protein